MEKYSLSLLHDHRHRTKDGCEGPIEVRLTISRKSYYINTNVHVRMNEWAGTVVCRSDADALNERLGLIVQRVREIITDIQRSGQPIDVGIVKDLLWATDEKDKKDSMLEWIESQIPLLGVCAGTMTRYYNLLNNLRDFGRMCSWCDLSVENIYAFDAWLHTHTKPQTRAERQMKVKPTLIGDAAVYNYHKGFKALLHRAEKFGIIESNPYNRLQGEFKRGDKENTEYLTEEEMEAIMSLHPVPGTQMAAARDLFVFQMWTGLSYSDTQKFDIREYKKVNGKWINTGNRIKTGTAYIAQLLPPAVDVLERYGMQPPRLDNAVYNHALKAIQFAAGITTRLHSHLGRHSFATYMLSNDVSIQNVSKMLGHKSITQTQRYAKVLADDVHADYNRIEKKLKNKKQ